MAIQWSGAHAWLKASFSLGAWRTLFRPAQVLVLPGLAGESGVAGGADFPVPPFDAALLAWRDWCAAHVGQRCKVALSSRWVMTGVVAEAQATDAQAAATAMARQWDHYMNIGATALARDWLVRTTRAPGGWLVCATPRPLVADLMALAKAHRIAVVWMGPWWATGLQRWMRRASGVHHSQHLRVQEPGWCLHAQSERDETPTRVWRLWAEPVAWDVTSPLAMGEGACVALPRQGAAASACVWDDAPTQALVSGQSAAWREALP